MKVDIEVDIEINNSEKENIVVCYIPMIDSYFGAKKNDNEMIQRKANAMVKVFCDYNIKK